MSRPTESCGVPVLLSVISQITGGFVVSRPKPNTFFAMQKRLALNQKKKEARERRERELEEIALQQQEYAMWWRGRVPSLGAAYNRMHVGTPATAVIFDEMAEARWNPPENTFFNDHPLIFISTGHRGKYITWKNLAFNKCLSCRWCRPNGFTVNRLSCKVAINYTSFRCRYAMYPEAEQFYHKFGRRWNTEITETIIEKKRTAIQTYWGMDEVETEIETDFEILL
jgi:hypothetical protein